MKEANIDPITLTVIWNGLLAIAEEMGSTLRRTAFSEAVREGEDFSTGVFDIQARLVAQGNFTPGHLGSMPYVVRTVLEYFPVADLHPGDAILLNDSFIGSGHFPDCFLVSPALLNNEDI
ncbi:MAG: hydantoinase B/oxoprolinase family protein, partial [Rhodospirillales bacterium]